MSPQDMAAKAYGLTQQWRDQADDYMRLYRSARCGCSSADRQVYLRVALTLKDCAEHLDEAFHAPS